DPAPAPSGPLPAPSDSLEPDPEPVTPGQQQGGTGGQLPRTGVAPVASGWLMLAGAASGIYALRRGARA
ncbi:MAG TPA: cell wall anchor protein, partial [Actinomycetota bacterium]|nr:cell wall anchor protein [Actinomycetota bacterium]